MFNGFFNALFKRFTREERELHKFFKELVAPLRPIEYLYHPADEILRAYLAGRLSNAWRLDDPQILAQFTQGELEDWQRAEVSSHVLSCQLCSQKLSAWRAAERVQQPIEQAGRRRRWAYGLSTLAAGIAVSLGVWFWVSHEQIDTVFGQVKDADCEALNCGKILRPSPGPPS